MVINANGFLLIIALVFSVAYFVSRKIKNTIIDRQTNLLIHYQIMLQESSEFKEPILHYVLSDMMERYASQGSFEQAAICRDFLKKMESQKNSKTDE